MTWSRSTERLFGRMKIRFSALLTLLALLSYAVGDHLHLALEHHHWCPVSGEPVHHEHPGTACDDEESSPHKSHSANDHLQASALRTSAKQVQADAAPAPSLEALPAPVLVRAVLVCGSDRPRDPPRIRLRPSRAPPLV